MNTRIICYIVLMSILLVVSSGCSAQGIITKQQALSAVQNFESNQNIQLRVENLETEEDGYSQSGMSKAYYVFEIATPDTGFSWGVNAYTGEVFEAYYSSRIPTTESDTPYGSYTQTQCNQIALNFARNKYSNFDSMGYQLTTGRWDKNGWKFVWTQVNQYGAYGINRVNVSVNSNNGLIQKYTGSRYPVYAAQQPPSITSQQSIPLAAQASGITNLTSNDSPVLCLSSTTMYWRLGVVGVDASNKYIDVVVDIDAYDGSAIKILRPLSVPARSLMHRNKTKPSMNEKTINKKKKEVNKTKNIDNRNTKNKKPRI